jgi:hypothetical protein
LQDFFSVLASFYPASHGYFILKTAVGGADLSDFALFSLPLLAKWRVKQP